MEKFKHNCHNILPLTVPLYFLKALSCEADVAAIPNVTMRKLKNNVS